jgi:ankyrin repeat protein
MLTNQQMASDIRDLSLISLKNIEDLIGLGFNINEQDFEGNTYLHHCIKSCNIKLIEILCKSGANVFAKNIYKKMPIDAAWEHPGAEDVLAVILNNSVMAGSIAELRRFK